MKITHVNSGKAYNLKPNTQLEVERTNLFFNEWGEQSNPINLPDTDRNRELTNYPDLLSGNDKPSASIPITIQDGNYFIHGRQAILSAQRKSDICTSFYMNEGSFLSRISDTSLKDIFKDETILGVTTVQQGIDFCRSLISGSNNEYAIFPVLIDSGETYNDGYPKYKYINRIGYEEDGKWIDDAYSDCIPTFYNAVPRKEIAEGKTVELPAGYYISPFIRCNYLLKRILQYFGYTMTDNFFTKTHPFTQMVFINNCADSLVNGTIRVVDLLPDCMCSTILEVFRKKFCCEFIPNEVDHAVDIRLFNEAMSADPTCDLSPYLVAPYKNDIPESYQQIILSSEEHVSDAIGINSPESLPDLENKYQYIKYDEEQGVFLKYGFKFYRVTSVDPEFLKVAKQVASSSMRYYDGGNLKTKKIEVPDIMPEFRNSFKPLVTDNNLHSSDFFSALYIGPANFLNSKLEDSDSDDSEAEKTSNNTLMKPMLAFFYNEKNFPRGTITSKIKIILEDSRKLSDYSLCYNGNDGIFERFYRTFDDIHRNSMRKVTASLLLPDDIKQKLPAHLPVILHNQKLLLNGLKYAIGGKGEPLETTLFTTKLYTPVSEAKKFSDYISGYQHDWIPNSTVWEATDNEYNTSPFKDKKFDTVYPQKPTDDLAIPGKHYYEQSSCFKYGATHMLLTWWLECI